MNLVEATKEFLSLNEHDEIRVILPWFVNGSLAEKEQDRVMKHLRHCEMCRGERDQFQQIELGVQQSDAETNLDYQPGFAQLMKRIDIAEQNKLSTAVIPPVKQARHWAYGVAAGVVVVVAYMAGFVNQPEEMEVVPVGVETYETLTSSPLPAAHHDVASNTFASRKQTINIVLKQPVFENLRTLLIETNAKLESGPHADGQYAVEFEISEHESDAEFVERLEVMNAVQTAALSSSSSSL